MNGVLLRHAITVQDKREERHTGPFGTIPDCCVRVLVDVDNFTIPSLWLASVDSFLDINSSKVEIFVLDPFPLNSSNVYIGIVRIVWFYSFLLIQSPTKFTIILGRKFGVLRSLDASVEIALWGMQLV